MSATPTRTFETVIVGGGPAALQMGYFLNQSKCDYIALEATDGPAAFFKKFPRHRMLISLNKRFNVYPEKEFNMRHDWNSLLTKDYSLLMTNYSTDLFPSADSLVKVSKSFFSRIE